MSTFTKLALGLAMLLAAGCTTAPTSRGEREQLQDDVTSTIKRMYLEDPGLQSFLQRAYGYAIIPSIGKGGFIAAGAYGKGQVYQGGQFIGYADISQATIGATAGGQSFDEVIAFENSDALNKFERNQLAFSANASAVALKAGAAASADYSDGVAVFVDAVGGLMIEASIGGQSFTYQPK